MDRPNCDMRRRPILRVRRSGRLGILRVRRRDKFEAEAERVESEERRKAAEEEAWGERVEEEERRRTRDVADRMIIRAL